MNNTLTAKEWLEKEELCNPKVMGNHPCDDLFQGYDCSTVMEKYANYKNRILEDKIKKFRKEIKDIGVTIDGCRIVKKEEGICYNIQNAYDKHFNINKETI